MDSPEYNIGEISRRLGRVRLWTIAIGIVTALVTALLVLGASWLLVSFLDMELGLPWMALRAIAVAGGLAALLLLALSLHRTFRASHSIKRYAARIGSHLKEIGLDLLTALDLAEVDGGRLGYSDELIKRTIEQIASRVRKLDLMVAVRRRDLSARSIPLAAVIVASLLWWAGAPGSFHYSLDRMRFFLGLTSESGVAVSVEPGDVEIPAGEPLDIEARVKGFVESDAVLHILSDAEETRFRMVLSGAEEGPGDRTFTSGIARVDKDIDYFVSVADQTTRIYHVSVLEQPRITGGMIRLRPPAYTGLPQQVVPEGVWDITALYGTEADFSLSANCSPDSIRFERASPDGRQEWDYFSISGDSLTYRLDVVGDLEYSFRVVAMGSVAEPHGPHRVRVVEDAPPYVRIESPGKEMILEADMLVPLSARALDDYGISSMRLHYKSPAESGFVDLAYTGRTEARCDLNWDVGVLNVFPGEAVYYYVEVADNDLLKGPKFARTETYVARIPTVYEFYAEIEDRQDQDIESLEGIEEEMEELGESVDDLAEEMKQGRDMDWEREQSMKKTLDRQGEVADDIEDVASSMDETLDMMSESNLVNFEMIEKMEEIRRLLDEVATDEFRQALERMQQAMEQLDPEDIKAAMENLDFSQEDLMRRLDATIEMLKRLRLEQKMDAVQNLAESILEGEKAVNQRIGEGGDLEELSQAERGLRKDALDLAGMMQELSDQLRSEMNPAASKMQDASEFMESSGVSGKMSEKMSQMSQGDRQKSSSKGSEIESDMAELAEMINEARETFAGGRQREIVEALTAVMNDLREVSARHENVMSRMLETPDEGELGYLARREMVYKEALDRAAEALYEASRKSVYVPAELGKKALSVAESMENASGRLHEGQVGRANNSMKSALRSMNELIAYIAEATDNASSCSSSSSMCDAFQSLENMSCQQMGINMGTQSLFDENGQLSMEARAQMARLAAEQESVRRGLEEMLREYGNRGEILGRLDDLIQEAERVVEDLRRRQVNEETLRRQEKILTRLLNAQKSLRRRDYSQRRKSKPGEDLSAKPPPELSLEERERMMEDILYRRRGYYPPEYEDLIRAYMKAISERK